MATLPSGRRMYTSFDAAHEAFLQNTLPFPPASPNAWRRPCLRLWLERSGDGRHWFIISADPTDLQHLISPKLMEGDHEGFSDLPELIQHAHLDPIVE